ncbi:MAG: hypothetical protein KGI38_13030 [Thaumarchaeota archaeon]|nr:hypothetical protein [Nitrososphaerota archaeon]
MSRLTYAQRERLPARDFVFPRTRKYPIPDSAHARNALARVARSGTAYQRRKVCMKVHRRFPKIHEASCSLHRLRA